MKPRPTVRDRAIVEAAAKRLLPGFRAALHDTTTPDKTLTTDLEHLLAFNEHLLAFNTYEDGYHRARALARRFYEPNDELVEFLAGIDAEPECEAAVAAWVREMGLHPPFAVGSAVTIPGNPRIPGVIISHYEDQARSIVFCEVLGHVREGPKCRIVHWEDLRA